MSTACLRFTVIGLVPDTRRDILLTGADSIAFLFPSLLGGGGSDSHPHTFCEIGASHHFCFFCADASIYVLQMVSVVIAPSRECRAFHSKIAAG